MTLHKKCQHRGGFKRLHVCQECGYEAQHKQFLTDHINTIHQNKKLHKCDQCSYLCGFYNSLVSHKKIHQPDDIGRNGILDDH